LKIGSDCCRCTTRTPDFSAKNAKNVAKTPKTANMPKIKVNKGILLKNTPLPNLLRGGLQAEIGWI
jgi:hypothetical protein